MTAASWAAATQSTIGNVAAGSWFAVCQSAGMVGVSSTMTAGAAGVAGVGATGFAVATGKVEANAIAEEANEAADE